MYTNRQTGQYWGNNSPVAETDSAIIGSKEEQIVQVLSIATVIVIALPRRRVKSTTPHPPGKEI
jgi:hypothetical protein